MSDDTVQRLMGLADNWVRASDAVRLPISGQAALAARAALGSAIREALRDGERLDFLDSLTSRVEFQNARRHSVPVMSDMHFSRGFACLYIRNMEAGIVSRGEAATVREAIDAAMSGREQDHG